MECGGGVTVSAVEILLAAASALVYGTGDFFGGLASRRVASIVVTAVSQFVGLALLLVVAPLWPHPHVSATDWWWGGAGGLFGAIGLSMFFTALSRGAMAAVAPTTALVSAVVPVVVGVIGGDRPQMVAWIGVVLAFPAIALVAGGLSAAATRISASTLALSIGAGLGFGSFFAAFSQTHHGAGMVPLLAARLASATLLGVVLVIRGRSIEVGAPHRRLVVASGLFDVSANGLYLLAVSRGMLSTVAVVAAMYPASTVVLARVVLGERLAKWQQLGLALAAASVTMVALGR